MEKINLAWDLIEDILYRVPAKSLARFRSTSKQWHALLKSGSFAEKHSANAPKEESLSIMLIDSKVFLVKINLHGFHDEVAPSVKVAYQFSLKDPDYKSSQEVDIRNVFHCDGLLLCTTQENRLVVWNPCSGETKWIQPRDSYKETDYYALGYDKRSSCKQYKVLRVNQGYEIYDLTSNSWRVLNVVTGWFVPNSHRGISVKGNTYWLAKQSWRPHARFLLSFDFSTESYQSLSLPLPFHYRLSALSVVREEQICMVGTSYTEEDAYSRDLHVWVTNIPVSLMSWSKFLIVKANDKVYIYGSSFLVDEENKAVVYYCHHYRGHNKILHIVGANKDIVHVVHPDRDSKIKPLHDPLLMNYVPSLAPIKKGTLLGGRKSKDTSM